MATQCPVHEDVTLVQLTKKRMGFCGKCLKNYKICTAARWLAICVLVHDHAGRHKDAQGVEW